MPFSRSRRTAASMSPFVSWSARLQSIIGAPVRSRSSLTSAAEISAIRSHFLGNVLLARRLLARRDLFVVALGHRRLLLLLGGGGAVRRRRREVGGRPLLLSGCDAVGDHPHDQLARADGVVVAGNDVVGLVWIAVRVDERDDRQAEPARFPHRELLLAQIDDEDGVRLALHLGDAAEVLVELLELTEHRDPLLRRQEVELAFLPQAAELVEAVDAVGDRAPVRQEPTEPPMVDVWHAEALRLLLHRGLALLLRADEEDRAAPFGEGARERAGLFQKLQR